MQNDQRDPKPALFMKARTIKTLVLSAVLVLSCSFLLRAETGKALPYPTGYLQWAHIKKEIMAAQEPALKGKPRIYHIYANEKAVEGYRNKQFADGSIIVADFFDTKETNGVTEETTRLRLAMMIKDANRFGKTGGWGFEQFKGDSQTESTLQAEGAANCYACHSKQKQEDMVFTNYRR
jgi:hypothetical protein